MRRHVKNVAISSLLASVWLAACGGGDGGGQGSGSFGSAESLAAAIEAPTGTVDDTTAVAVAEEFEAQMNSDVPDLGGARENVGTIRQAQQSATVDCTEGGTISATGDENRTNVRYNNCREDGCVLNGEGTFFASGAGEYAICMSYDVSMSCDDGDSARVAYSGCLGDDGGYVYLIEVNGDTYTVSGYYSDGSGELTIRGANGTFTCTYAEGSGTCVGDDGSEFDF